MFIGIDQSITQTAITILHTPANFNTYTFEGKGKTTKEKLKHIYLEVAEFLLLESKKYGQRIDRCFIEGGSFNSGGQLFTLGQLSGLILSTLIMCRIPYKEVPPSSLKKFISGKGDANKESVMKSIMRKYGVKFTNDNKADSYVLALMAYAYTFMGPNEFDFREELEWVEKEKKKDAGIKEGATKPRYRRKKGEF